MIKNIFSPESFPFVGYPHNGIAFIYNQFPRRYVGGLLEMIQDLPRIADMGFNVVWINPIQCPTEYEASPTYKGSLYAMADDLLFNNDFFPEVYEHKKRVQLVQKYTSTARALGMVPIFDLVLNHVGKESPLEKKFLDQELLNTEPKNQWKDATFFDYADVQEENRNRKIVPNLQKQGKIIEQLWEPFVKRYIGTYGFMGVRVDAVINVEPGLQASVYKIIRDYCRKYHQTEPIILGEFMAQNAYRHIENLKDRGFTHVFAPATPYSRLLEYQPPPASYYYEDEENKNDIDGVIEQAKKLQEVASVAGILGNHDLAMLKTIVLLRQFNVSNDELHSKFEKAESFFSQKDNKKQYEDFDKNCDPQLREWILRIASTCNGGYYLLAGDEYGLQKKPSVFDNYKEPKSVEEKWGGNKNLSSYLRCVNYLLSQMPQATKGDKVAHEKRMVNNTSLHVIWRTSAKDNQEHVICTSEKTLSLEEILGELKCGDKNIYFVQNNSQESKLFHYNPKQPNLGLKLIGFNQLTPLQLLQKSMAYYHIAEASKIVNNLVKVKEGLQEASNFIREAVKLNTVQDMRIDFYEGLIDYELDNNRKDEVIKKFQKLTNFNTKNTFILAENQIIYNNNNEELKNNQLVRNPAEITDNNMPVLNAITKFLIEINEIQLASEINTIILENNINDYMALLIKSKILYSEKNVDETKKIMLTIFQTIKFGNIFNIDFLTELGALAKDLGFNNEALECFKQAASHDSDNPEAWIKLAEIHLNLKQIAEGQRTFYKAGLAYMALREEEKAYNVFTTTINLEGKDTILYNQLGEQFILLAERKIVQAKRDFLNASETSGEKLELEAIERLEKAKQAFIKAENLHEENFITFFYLGKLFLLEQKRDFAIPTEKQKNINNNNNIPIISSTEMIKKKSVRYLNSALEKIVKEDFPINYIDQMGKFFSELGLKHKAELCYDKVFHYYKNIALKKPNFFYPFYKMGNASLVLNFEEAKKYLLQAFELTKEKSLMKNTGISNETGKMLILNNQLNYYDLGEDLIKVDCYEEALRCYKEVDKLMKEDYLFQCKLGDLYLKLASSSATTLESNYQNARTRFSVALKLYKKLPEAKQDPRIINEIYCKQINTLNTWAEKITDNERKKNGLLKKAEETRSKSLNITKNEVVAAPNANPTSKPTTNNTIPQPSDSNEITKLSQSPHGFFGYFGQSNNRLSSDDNNNVSEIDEEQKRTKKN